jgi:HPt (histidine-containing phosphotransfer) domain-containing protein
VEERERCLKAGMNDHVTKPIDPEALFAALARWTKPQDSTAAAAVAVGGETPKLETPLPAIEGIDIADGLRRVAGNARLYRSLLEQFVAKQSDTDVKISEGLERGDRELAQRLAHTLKGVAGNIGIGRVQQAAAKVEKAIRERDLDVGILLSELRSAIYQQVAAIRAATAEASPAPAAAADFDAEAACRAVGKLKALLDANDGDAADAVEEVAAAFAGRVDASRLSALRACIEEFDFDGAQLNLSQIAADSQRSAGQPDARLPGKEPNSV